MPYLFRFVKQFFRILKCFSFIFVVFNIANCLFCFEGNVRYAAILGYVGAGGLGLILNEKIGWREYPSVGMILVTLFVTVMVIEAISHYLRKKLT